MKFDLSKWQPITVMAVIAVTLLILGGLLTVILTSGQADPYTYREFLDDLKYVAAALGLGAGIGRGFLAGKKVEAAAHVSAPRSTRRHTD